jgi:hypothetical protein
MDISLIVVDWLHDEVSAQVLDRSDITVAKDNYLIQVYSSLPFPTAAQLHAMLGSGYGAGTIIAQIVVTGEAIEVYDLRHQGINRFFSWTHPQQVPQVLQAVRDIISGWVTSKY